MRLPSTNRWRIAVRYKTWRQEKSADYLAKEGHDANGDDELVVIDDPPQYMMQFLREDAMGGTTTR